MYIHTYVCVHIFIPTYIYSYICIYIYIYIYQFSLPVLKKQRAGRTFPKVLLAPISFEGGKTR